jgi:hypothetical protein
MTDQTKPSIDVHDVRSLQGKFDLIASATEEVNNIFGNYALLSYFAIAVVVVIQVYVLIKTDGGRLSIIHIFAYVSFLGLISSIIMMTWLVSMSLPFWGLTLPAIQLKDNVCTTNISSNIALYFVYSVIV